MKKGLLIALFMSLIFGTTAFAEPDEIKFRGYEWGCSRSEIWDAEITSDMVDEVDYYNADDFMVLIKGSVSIFSCNTYFSFNENDQLCSGYYSLTEKHANDNSYYDDFKTLEEALISVYGEPQSSIDLWSDDLFKDDPDDIGLAIAAEHLKLIRSWDAKDGSNCMLQCYGKNYDITTSIGYFPPEEMELAPEDNSKTNGL